MSPDNLACIMIDDHCYVLVSLLVAGFVNVYADKSRKACGWIGIKFSPHPANDRADGIPGNPEQRGNSGFRAGQGEPSGQILKFLCETGLMPCPRNRCRNNPMLGTHDTIYICYNIDLVGIPVASPPRTGATTAIVIADRFSAAYATTALFAFGRMCLDGNCSIWQNFHVIYSGMLDI